MVNIEAVNYVERIAEREQWCVVHSYSEKN